MSFKLALLVVVATIATSQAAFGVDFSKIIPLCHDWLTLGESRGTVICIAGHLCAARKDEAKVKAWSDCYDENNGEGKEQFLGCMDQALGRVLNTTSNVQWMCGLNILKMKGYADCLPGKFQEAGLDMSAIVTRVNICQGKALGIGNGKV